MRALRAGVMAQGVVVRGRAAGGALVGARWVTTWGRGEVKVMRLMPPNDLDSK